MYPIFRRQSTRYQHSLPTLATNARWHSPPRPEALGSGPQKLHANDAAGRGLWFFVIRRCRNCQTGGRTGLSDMITFFRSNSTKHRIPLVEKRGRLYRNLKDYGTLDEIYRRFMTPRWRGISRRKIWTRRTDGRCGPSRPGTRASSCPRRASPLWRHGLAKVPNYPGVWRSPLLASECLSLSVRRSYVTSSSTADVVLATNAMSPLTYAITITALSGVAILACCLPARRPCGWTP
jgi:hypothetical protein